MKVKPEQFSDQISRLFYPNQIQRYGIKGDHVYNITIQVTETCNLKCSYCYQHEKSSISMTFDTAKAFIDIILAGDEKSNKYIDSWDSRGVVIEFIGGEPFLEIDLIDQISEYFINEMIRLQHPWLYRFRFNISTNGTLYFEPKVQKYINKYKRFLNLTITIDGNKELHDACRRFPTGEGSYDIVHRAVQDWRQYQTLDQTKITVSPENVNKVYEALLFLIKEEQYKTIFINCVYEKGWQDSDGTILYNELQKINQYLLDNDLQDDIYITILDDPCGKSVEGSENPWCGGSGCMICLDPRGDIYPCLRYCPNAMGYEKASKMKIGDIKHGFVYNEEQEQILKEFSCVDRQSQLDYHQECAHCQIREGCGDCAAYSYEVSGKIGYRTNYHCITHIARVLASTYLKNKSYLKTHLQEPLPLLVSKEQALRIISEEEFNYLLQISKEANKNVICK